jgi:hypothetical protein
MNSLEIEIAKCDVSQVILIYSSDLPGISLPRLQEITRSGVTVFGFADAVGSAQGLPDISSRPTSSAELLAYIRGNIRSPLLRTPLLQPTPNLKARIIGVGSASHSTGNTVLALNLAQESALLGAKTLLIDANFQAPAIANFINDRTAVRNQIAQEASCTTDQVKLVINAVLQGSVLSTHSSSKLFDVLNHDYALIQRLKTSVTLNNLRNDIKSLWQCLRDEFVREQFVDKNGCVRTRKLSARQKSAYYRQFENQVARVIQKSLRKQKLRFLWVHDGWQCDQVVDPAELIQQVRRKTGFVIKLDWAVYED